MIISPPAGGGSVTVSQIADASANGRSLISAADYAAMRTLLSEGRTLIGTTAISAASSLNIPSVFSATYRFYEVLVYCTGSAQLDLRVQLSASGTAEAGALYYTMGQRIDLANSLTGLGSSGGTYWLVGRATNNGSLLRMTFANPYHAVSKQLISDCSGSDDAQVYGYTEKGLLTSSTLYDGFKLTASTGNISGTTSVYGVNS